MGTLRQGALNLVKTCMNYKPTENSIIVTDKAKYEIGNEIFKAAMSFAENGAVNELLLLENYGQRPLTELPKKIAEKIPSADVTFWVAENQKGELPMRMQFRELALKHGREAHMPGIDKQLMEQGMCADYNEVFKLTNKVHDIVKKAKVAEVSTPVGTRLRVEFDSNLRWKPCHGLYHKKGEWGNEPEGEVFTCPRRVDGTLIAEEVGDWIGEKYGILTPPESKYNTPVYLEVENSRVILDTVRTKNRELETDIIKYLQTDENSDRVGESAFPTNVEVIRLPLTGNLLQDEKARFHIAFGNPYPDETGANWQSKTHIDCVIKNATVVLQPGSVRLMEKDKYVF